MEPSDMCQPYREHTTTSFKPTITIRNLPLELHYMIFQEATSFVDPIPIYPKEDASSAFVLPSISPLYASSLTLSLIPRFYAENTFLLTSPGSFCTLRRVAGPHFDRIQHLVFPVTQTDTWYSLLAGHCKGLRKITMYECDGVKRSFRDLFISETRRRAEQSQGPDLGRGLAFGVGKTAGDSDARRFIEVLCVKRPEITDFLFDTLSREGTLSQSPLISDSELLRVINSLRERDPISGSKPANEDHKHPDYNLRDWELLWEQAVLDDMKAWARGADRRMRAAMRSEGWMIRLLCLKRLRDNEDRKLEMQQSWTTALMESWPTTFRLSGLGAD